ncbi:unnamed protein product [Phytomonas sp. EM1]|nr:unnamed protein product [Phytomonas sp. EM1]|eukprot:CCW60585.1 unnamed protein product [Phytomonas sp. isolate EM1]
MSVRVRSRVRPHGAVKHAASTPLTTSALSETAQCSSSPCEDERAYKELIRQRDDRHRRICQKNHALAELERSILRFYYDHSMCYEKELRDILESASPLALDSTAKVLSPGSSEVSRRMREFRAQEERQATERAAYKDAIVRMEEEYERTVIHGKLAAQQEVIRLAQSELHDLNVELEKQKRIDQNLVSLIDNLERELRDLRKEKDNSAQRMAVLEEKKRNQMENLGNTRLELQQAHADALQARKELERREAVIGDLQSQIEEHSLRLKRRKLT